MLSRRAFLSSTALAAQQPQRPNILFVMVDEMRFDAMGCAGHATVKTPTLDKLASQGAIFRNAYTVSPVCCPSRASVFSGRYPHVHGVRRNGIPHNDGEIFLPTILRHHGYHTAIAGKLHYNPKRFSYGFDDFWTFTNEGPRPDNGHIAYLRNKHGKGAAKWASKAGTQPWPDDELGKDVGEFAYPIEDFETEWITDRSIAYLRQRAQTNQPFFLFASYLKPHSPSVEPKPYFNLYNPDTIPVRPLPANAREQRAKAKGRARRKFIDDEKMQRVMTALYYGAITHIDTELARLFKELDRLGLAKNTIVLFTSDHGNMLGDRGLWFKDFMYEGSAHVPLIVKTPTAKPREFKQVIENIDLMPTLLDYARIAIPAGIQGRSFKPLIETGAQPNWKDRCISDLTATMHLAQGWKFIDNHNGTLELYDLGKDPQETNNLVNDPRFKSRLHFAQTELAKWRAERPPKLNIPGLPTPDYSKIDKTERAELIQSAPPITLAQ
ncbi:MAG: sulfatase [Bryobacteraceae bacterium]